MLREKLFVFYGIHFPHSVRRELATKLSIITKGTCLFNSPCVKKIYLSMLFEYLKYQSLSLGRGRGIAVESWGVLDEVH